MRYFIIVMVLASVLAGCGAAETPPTTAQQPRVSPTTMPTPASSSAPVSISATPTTTLVPVATPSVIPTHTAAPVSSETALPAPAYPPPHTTATPTPAGKATVGGTIALPAQPALPPDAVLTVKLMLGVPIFHYDTPEYTYAEQRITPLKPGPIPFAIEYDRAIINPVMPYKIVAEVHAGGQRLLTGGSAVITSGNPSTVEVALHPTPSATTITGTVTYTANRPLPPDALLTIQLTTPTDGIGGPMVVGEQRISPVGAGPIPFTIGIDPATINPYNSYTITASITAPGRIPWRVDELPVLTWGHPTTIDVMIPAPPHVATISGTISYPEQSALPPDAELSVWLLHGTDPRVPSEPTPQLTLSPVPAGPVPFTIEYDTTRIDPQQSYAIYANIRVGGRLPLTTRLYPVITQNHPTTIDAVLAPPQELITITGTITYPAQPALPADAVLTVELRDVSGTDGPSWLLAKERIAPIGPSPVAFAIEYDPVLVDRRNSYAIFTTIGVGAQPIFIDDLYRGVLTQDAPTTLEINLKPVR